MSGIIRCLHCLDNVQINSHPIFSENMEHEVSSVSKTENTTAGEELICLRGLFWYCSLILTAKWHGILKPRRGYSKYFSAIIPCCHFAVHKKQYETFRLI